MVQFYNAMKLTAGQCSIIALVIMLCPKDYFHIIWAWVGDKKDTGAL